MFAPVLSVVVPAVGTLGVAVGGSLAGLFLAIKLVALVRTVTRVTTATTFSSSDHSVPVQHR